MSRLTIKIMVIFIGLLFIEGGLCAISLSDQETAKLNQVISDGYLDAEYTVKGDTKRLNRGERYRIYTIDLSYGGSDQQIDFDDLIANFHGKQASRKNLQSLGERLVDRMSDNGYPFAQSQILNLRKTDPDSLRVSYEITTGPYVTIDSITFRSDSKVSDQFLIKRSGLEPGSEFSDEVIRSSVRRINSLPYLNIEQPPNERYFNNFRSCRLIYDIKKIGANRLEGALGYNPGTANRDGFIFGFLDLAFHNPLGDGKSFYIEWDKPGESSSRIRLRTYYPYPFGLGLEFNAGFAQEQFSDLYLSLDAELEVLYRFYGMNTLSLGGSWSRIDARGDDFRSVFDSRFYRGWIGIDLTSFDNSHDLDGQHLNLRLTYIHKRLYETLDAKPQDPSQNPFRADLEARYSQSFAGRYFANARFSFAGFSDDEKSISPAEMIHLGGRETVRGYSEEQFLTPRAVWTNLELGVYSRHLLRAYIFNDLAYARISNIYVEQDQPSFENEFLYGFGLGMRLYSGNTALNLAAGWSRDDNFRQGKLYLIVENNF